MVYLYLVKGVGSHVLRRLLQIPDTRGIGVFLNHRVNGIRGHHTFLFIQAHAPEHLGQGIV